jgi:hypothetical protein
MDQRAKMLKLLEMGQGIFSWRSRWPGEEADRDGPDHGNTGPQK